jgi:hypothetical protein
MRRLESKNTTYLGPPRAEFSKIGKLIDFSYRMLANDHAHLFAEADFDGWRNVNEVT